MHQCLVCGRDIPDGEQFMSLDYLVGRTQRGGSVVDVDDAATLLIACRSCAPSAAAVAETLRSAGWPATAQ